MIWRRNGARKRRGVTVVETALVIATFLLFLLGIFEYGRYLMLENLFVNACREGCRYALVHSQDATVVADTQTQVTNRLGGQNYQFPDLAITVYPTNSPASAMSTLNPDDPVTVKITGTFKSLFPNLLFLPSSWQIKSSCIMTCEGN